jgi:hypothetical protein
MEKLFWFRHNETRSWWAQGRNNYRYRISENDDGGSPFSVFCENSWLGDYRSLSAAKARCTRDAHALEAA